MLSVIMALSLVPKYGKLKTNKKHVKNHVLSSNNMYYDVTVSDAREIF